MATELAKSCDVTVLYGDLAGCHPERARVEKWLGENSNPPSLKLAHVPPNCLTMIIHSLHQLPGMWFVYYVAYYLWQRSALRHAKALHASESFDVCHHLTVITFREPGFLWKLNIPFFWGPVAGSAIAPAVFLQNCGMVERFRWKFRNLMTSRQIAKGGRWVEAAKRAKKIWVVSKEDQRAFGGWGIQTAIMQEVGATGSLPGSYIRSHELGQTLKLCWSGLFQAIKGLDLLLRCLSQLPSCDFELNVLGRGPEEERWRRMAQELEIADKIRWHGMVPRQRALEVMARCHVFVHTSVKEPTGVV
jgi:glycosyltransferase involved in cell wall biosynthesis